MPQAFAIAAARALAEALAEADGAGTFSRTIDPKFAYAPTWDLEDLAELQVSIVPRSKESTQASRGQIDELFTIEVGLQEQCQPTDLDKIDELLALADEIETHLEEAGDLAGAYWVSNERDPLFFPDHLREHSVFTTVIAATYRRERDRGEQPIDAE